MRREDVDAAADHQLMQKVRDGDIGQLGTLFERYSGVLFNFFVRMTGNVHVSEDLVQDVFFRILKYRHTYRDQSRFSTWMYQIARNACMDDRRKKKHEVELLDDECGKASSSPLPGDDLERRQEFRLVRTALAQLAPDKREVLVLSRYQNLKYDQIAEILACDVGAIKVRIYRAMRDLRYAYLRLKGEKASCDARR
jgi:RNA polymerase sigma factor (sigma-70 family)